MNNQPGLLRTAVNNRRMYLINRLNKYGYEKPEKLSSYSLSDLEAAHITHMANIGRIITQQSKEQE